MIECKKALDENNWNIQLAFKTIKKNSISAYPKKSDRISNFRVIYPQKQDNKLYYLAVSCETDFVQRNDQFLISITNIVNSWIDNNHIDNESLYLLAYQFQENIKIIEANTIDLDLFDVFGFDLIGTSYTTRTQTLFYEKLGICTKGIANQNEANIYNRISNNIRVIK